jgi:hypothetical protein
MVSLYTARFNIHKFYVLPTQCIYVFCVDLRTNSDYFPIQHYLTGFYNRDGVCLLRGRGWEYILQVNMAQAVSRRPLTAKDQVRSQVSPCEISGGQSCSGTGFSPSTSVLLCQYYTINARYSSSSTYCCYQKDKLANATCSTLLPTGGC